MKNLFLILILVLSSTIVIAQAPQKMHYQAVIRDANSNLISNKTIGIRISILKESASGTSVYTEIQTPETNSNGLISIEIGDESGFSSIDWTKGSFYLKTEIDPTGNTNYTITGISQLLSVPYAFHAKTAETLTGGISLPPGNTKGDMQYWNGTEWVIIHAGKPGQYLQLSESGTPVWAGSPVASLTTTAASSQTTTSVITGGLITDNGSSPITKVGVCYSKLPNPDITDSITTDSIVKGGFVSTITGLTPSTTYYIRAYAMNETGTGYGNEIIITTPVPKIGDIYQGGLITYIFQSGDPGYVAGEIHGFIAAPYDQGSGIEWGCTGTAIGCSATVIGSGVANIALIVSGCSTTGIAAKICDDLVLNGYSDWFLPSKDELMLMYNNLHTYGYGAFSYGHYWSSSETNANSATKVDFLIGSPSGSTKSYTNKYVRAMRKF